MQGESAVQERRQEKGKGTYSASKPLGGGRSFRGNSAANGHQKNPPQPSNTKKLGSIRGGGGGGKDCGGRKDKRQKREEKKKTAVRPNPAKKLERESQGRKSPLSLAESEQNGARHHWGGGTKKKRKKMRRFLQTSKAERLTILPVIRKSKKKTFPPKAQEGGVGNEKKGKGARKENKNETGPAGYKNGHLWDRNSKPTKRKENTTTTGVGRRRDKKCQKKRKVPQIEVWFESSNQREGVGRGVAGISQGRKEIRPVGAGKLKSPVGLRGKKEKRRTSKEKSAITARVGKKAPPRL